MTDAVTQANAPEGFTPIISSNPFGAHIGPIFEKIEGDGFVRAIRVSDKHLNSGGVAHGGVLMTFADIVLGQAMLNATGGGPAVTVRLVSDFIAPAKDGVWVEGRAEVSRAGKTLIFVSGALTVEGKTIFTAQGTFKPL